MRSERITDPLHASQMMEHRMSMVVASAVATKMYAIMHAKDREEAVQLFARLAQLLSRTGGLFQTKGYSLEEERARIANTNEYVCMRAGASVTDSSAHDDSTIPQFLPFNWASEMRTRLAPVGSTTPFTYIPDPNCKDAFYGNSGRVSAQDTAREIYDNPGTIAAIEDVYTYRNGPYRKHGIASAARKGTDDVIEADINPERPRDEQITTYIANMFRLEAMHVTGEEKFVLPRPILNTDSILMHARSQEFDANHVWWHPADEPVETEFIPDGKTAADSKQAFLTIGWETVVLKRKNRS